MTVATDKLVYEAEDIKGFLGLGKNKIYDYLDKVYEDKYPFKVIKIGKLYKIPKKSFDEWINGEGS